MHQSPLPHAVGVICEFNPIHNGHVRLLREARHAVGDSGCVLCIMSGRFVQRGDPAAADPYLRARMALYGGADVVLELPFPWSAASAEFFADAGVSILSRVGAKMMAFGTECGDLSLLQAAADVLIQPNFSARSAALVRDGKGAAAAMTTLLHEALAGQYALPDGFPASNDRLAMQYLRALHTAGADMTALVIRRDGQDYRDTTLRDVTAPSASALRRLTYEASSDPDCLAAMLENTMPGEALNLWLNAVRTGQAPASGIALLPFFHTFFRLADPDVLASHAGLSGGLSHRMVRAASEAATPSAFLDALRSRLYTDARLRRAMLYGTIGVTESDLRMPPVYTTLLAANVRGCAYLKAMRLARKNGQEFISIVTRPAHAPASRQRELSTRADSLFTLCLPFPTATGDCLRRNAWVEQ